MWLLYRFRPMYNLLDKEKLFFIASAECTHEQVEANAQALIERQFLIQGVGNHPGDLLATEEPMDCVFVVICLSQTSSPQDIV